MGFFGAGDGKLDRTEGVAGVLLGMTDVFLGMASCLARQTAFHLASTQARYALERHAWDEAALIVPREPAALEWDRFTWPEAIAQFARGLGAAHLGKADVARAAGERLGQLEAATRKAGEELFARNIQVLRLELNAGSARGV